MQSNRIIDRPTMTTTTSGRLLWDRRRCRRPAFAMMMVKVVVAVAAVLALSLLYSSTLQAKAATGRTAVVQAELLAESGLNRATYYIFNQKDPAKCPFTLAIGATYSESSVSL